MVVSANPLQRRIAMDNKFSAKKEQAKGFFSGIVLGGVMGGIVALLKAPRSGKATRRQLQKQALEIQNQVEHVVDGAREQLQETSHQVMEQAEAVRKRMQEVSDDGLQRIAEFRAQAVAAVPNSLKK
jgi:gas vesicle protein